MQPIAHIYNAFDGKFGVPRQSGLCPNLRARIVFEPPYRVQAALRGLEDFSHIWLIWEFSAARREEWSPTVRPPRLGGNRRMGVFATRSPFRPNPIGLSCVRLEGIEHTEQQGDTLVVSGADLMNGTPIYDIKPYLPYADSHPEATDGFAGTHTDYTLSVDCAEPLLARLPQESRAALLDILAQDPRPAYQNDGERVYGFGFGGFEIKFSVREGVLRVVDIIPPRR